MKLHDYIGSLVISVQHARVSADLQAVRVAEDYAKHRLLEHFPVPRMRLKDVEITFPVAITPNQDEPVSRQKSFNSRQIASLAYQETLSGLGLESLNRASSQRFRQFINEETQLLDKAIIEYGETQALETFSHKIAKQGFDIQVTDLSDDDLRKRVSHVAERLSEKLKDTIKPQPGTDLGNLDVSVETDILREKSAASLVNIKLTIQEDGVEWHRMEDEDGKVTRKLIPE